MSPTRATLPGTTTADPAQAFEPFAKGRTNAVVHSWPATSHVEERPFMAAL